MGGFAIIQNARKGGALGIDILGLVDRARSKRFWWTSDNANILICYRKKSAADFAADRLKLNSARVVPFEYAARLISQQSQEISRAEFDLELLDMPETPEEKYGDSGITWVGQT